MSCSLEPFRLANMTLDRAAYHWSTVSADGMPVKASNGMPTQADAAIADAPQFDLLFVNASYAPKKAMTPKILAYLRRQARFGTIPVGVEIGGLVLARAGLLDGYQATSHWDVLESMAEDYPDVLVKRDAFVFDRDRITVAGGAAAMDMALTLITLRHGHGLANRLAENFVLPGIRSPDAPQRFAAARSVGNATVSKAIEMMEANMDAALSIAEIADRLGLTQRALERLFSRWLSIAPATYYRQLRLRRAQALLQQTDLPVIEIAVMNGFPEAAHFSRSYSRMFGHPPSTERKVRR